MPRFESFVRAHQNMVYAVALRLLGDPAEAEDIAQTVFLKAWQQFARLEGNPAAAGWLRTVATNAALNHLTRHRRRWRLFSEMTAADGDDHAETFAEQLAAPVEVVGDGSDGEDAARLEQALHALPGHQRVPLVLFHFEQKRYDEIAVLLGISLGKVKTDVHRGRLALRRLMEAARESRRT
ncbi:MAG: RNA polymerase sigma factor [Acidobacteria bacterium]|nr:RNA polymerase sigma factor [Acidobacteriota bacterium]